VKSSLADYRRSVELISAPAGGGNHGLSHLNIWIVRTRLGDGETATGNSQLSRQRDVNPPHDWIWKIGSYFLGAITEENLLHAAILRNAGTNRDSRCEAWYYIGIRKLLSGERKALLIASQISGNEAKHLYGIHIFAVGVGSTQEMKLRSDIPRATLRKNDQAFKCWSNSGTVVHPDEPLIWGGCADRTGAI